jgi:hypothetical protein
MVAPIVPYSRTEVGARAHSVRVATVDGEPAVTKARDSSHAADADQPSDAQRASLHAMMLVNWFNQLKARVPTN